MRRMVAVAAGAWLVGSMTAITAGTTVPATRSGQTSSSIAIDALTPSECASMALTAIVTGSGSVNGSNAAELVLGSSGGDTVSASGGNDCVLGGGGSDVIGGGSGTDVCIGGPGIDTFTSCETQIQ